MKKIVFVNSSLTGGGSERVMTLIANYCATHGCQVTMLLLRQKEQIYSVEPAVKLVQLKNRHSKWKLLIRRVREIRREVKKSEADTVVAFMDDISFFTALACIGLRKKVVLSIRNDPRRPDKRFFWYLGKFFNNPLASRMVFQTPEAMACYPVRIRRKGTVIPNPIDENLPEPFFGEREKRVVGIGRMVPQKEFSLILDAFREFHEKHPEYALELYGDGPELENLEARARGAGLTDSVRFPGFVPDVDERLRTAAMYVSASDFEGISNTMLEALAMGVPTICTDCPVGGAAMMIQDHQNGILIPVGDESALVKAMNEIADSPELAALLSRSAVKVREDYSVEKIGPMWKKVLC